MIRAAAQGLSGPEVDQFVADVRDELTLFAGNTPSVVALLRETRTELLRFARRRLGRGQATAVC